MAGKGKRKCEGREVRGSMAGVKNGKRASGGASRSRLPGGAGGDVGEMALVVKAVVRILAFSSTSQVKSLLEMS